MELFAEQGHGVFREEIDRYVVVAVDGGAQIAAERLVYRGKHRAAHINADLYLDNQMYRLLHHAMTNGVSLAANGGDCK